MLALKSLRHNNVLQNGNSVARKMRSVPLCLLRWAVRTLSPSAPSMPGVGSPGAGVVGGTEELRQCALTPSLLSSCASGSSVGGYDDTSSDHSPANAADPPATSANSPATPSPAPTAAGTHASTGNCFLNSCSGGPCRYRRASPPEMCLGKEAAHILSRYLGAAVL